MNYAILVRSSAALFCVGLAVVASEGMAQVAPTQQAPDAMRAQLQANMQSAARTAQKYHAMDNAALLTRLMEESAAKREPFNSLAYRELQGRSDVDSAALVSAVRRTDNASMLLPLLLLRKLDEKSYLALPASTRAAVLTDALRGSTMFNTWGLPGIYQEDASKAMIEAGRSALPALERMLSETRPAPVFGGQEYMLYKRFQFRLCDYALYFVERIRGNATFAMPLSVDERDTVIRTLMRR